MAADRLQRLSLQVNRQQVLEGTSGDKDEAKAPTEIQRAHVLMH